MIASRSVSGTSDASRGAEGRQLELVLSVLRDGGASKPDADDHT
jgi:hypothetical protein